MKTLKKYFLATIIASVLLPTAPAQGLPADRALILYDSSGQFGWIGGLYAGMLANLLGHFDLPYQLAPVESYQPGQMDATRTTFYFGSVYENPLPVAFKDDALTTTNTLCWFKYNVWQVAGTNFTTKTGFRFNSLDSSGFSNIVYQGESLSKNQLDPQLGYISVLDTNLATVLATANKDDGTSIPYVTRSGNFWYVADIPFNYISEEDRYLAFADLLHDILGIDHAASHSAIIRLEDVAPTWYSSAALRATADLLRAENVPFAVALVPVYRDPLGYFNGGVPEEHFMSDASDTNSTEFVSDIRYLIANGAQLLLHGYTHQYDNVANPTTGATGFDFEFWRETFQTNNPSLIDIYGPVPEDSPDWVLGRINAAKAELRQVGLEEVGWEFPHYTASELDFRVAAINFPITMHRVIYFDEAGHIAGQFFPYPIQRDIYGQRIMPENIGNFVLPNPGTAESMPAGTSPARSADDLVRAARKNLVVRDGWAAGYFHPFYNLTNLQAMVEGIKALGYTYVPVSSDPPVIVQQPQAAAVVQGGTATFTVSAAGTPPLAYRWLFNDAWIAGADKPNLVVANLQPSNSGDYRVVVTNAFGAVTSSVATLTVGVPPAISVQPQPQNVWPGSNVTFNVTATGTAPLGYQWLFNGVELDGATGAKLVLLKVQVSDVGGYRVVVTNAFGATTSSIAALTLKGRPAITSQPQAQNVPAGTNVVLTVAATGSAPLKYRWQWERKNLPGATSSSLLIKNAQWYDAGNYRVIIANAYGAVTSAPAYLDVASPPIITHQPRSRTVFGGSSATFSAWAEGSAPLQYQWKFDGADIPGATSDWMDVNNIEATNAGTYTVAVTNAYGSAVSTDATLTVVYPPTITEQPQSYTNTLGTTVTFSVTASGTGPLRYQWRLNSANIRGATSSSYSKSIARLSDGGNYSVVVFNNYGKATSTNSKLTVK